MLSSLTLKNVWRWPLPLLPFPGMLQKSLSTLLPLPTAEAEIRRAWVLDGRLLRPLRALGYAVVSSKTGPGPANVEAPPALIGALAPAHAVLETLQEQISHLGSGGVVIWRCAVRERMQISAAFLHGGLLNIQQVRVGRGFLTAGMVPLPSAENQQ